jgi:S1-C subfamily serine protease
MKTRKGLYRVGLAAGLLAWSAALGPVSAQTAVAAPERCQMDAEKVFQRASTEIVEVYADAINPYRVRDRLKLELGAGFVIENGLVVTNYHVVADAQHISVYDGKFYWDAKVLGSDPLFDIAVLEVPGFVFGENALQLAPPETVAIGQKAFAIGYPRGLGKSITQRIVVGSGRVMRDTTSSWLRPFIQTDAAINPGNSGGPLLDDCGRVLGMITMGGTPSDTENIAFAIPGEVLGPIVDEIVATGHVSRAWHGLYGQMVQPAILSLLGVPYSEWEATTGFMVETVEPGSAADQIGIIGGYFPITLWEAPYLIGGDIITEVNGIRIDSMEKALNVVRGLKVGQTVDIVYLREGEVRSASIKLPERPVQEADLDLYRD